MARILIRLNRSKLKRYEKQWQDGTMAFKSIVNILNLREWSPYQELFHEIATCLHASPIPAIWFPTLALLRNLDHHSLFIFKMNTLFINNNKINTPTDGSKNISSVQNTSAGLAYSSGFERGRKRERSSKLWEYLKKNEIDGLLSQGCSILNCKRYFSTK